MLVLQLQQLGCDLPMASTHICGGARGSRALPCTPIPQGRSPRLTERRLVHQGLLLRSARHKQLHQAHLWARARGR